ncbi:MAG: hypothetical protein OEW19_08770 [Acidobacteriota bacterium]|nr:hypothetical protein [Acidobacteriota bacterium]
MRRATVLLLAIGVLMAMSGRLLAQDPCATLSAQGATLNGFAGARADALKSGDNAICDMWSKDRAAKLSLIVEPPRAAGGLAMRKMLAANAKEPGTTVKDEPTLGTGAYSFVSKEQLSFTGAGKGGVYTLTLNRDAGITAADEDRVRAIAKQFVEGR